MNLTKTDRLDWNDLRFLLTVVRTGSAAGAARALHVSHTTVLRRIQALETVMGCALFERASGGVVPTEAGSHLARLGASIESGLADTTRQIDAQATDLSGSVRFTTTDSFGFFVVPPILASFRQAYPNIRVDLVVTNTRLDLEKREADVTLRPSRNPPESWVGMRLARFDFGMYASRHYLADRAHTPWQMLDLVMPDGALEAPGAMLRAHAGLNPGIASSDTFTGLTCMAASGMGATLLPRFIGDLDSRLTLVKALPDVWSTNLWILTHAHLRRSGRVRAFMAHLAQGIRALRPILAPAAAE